jgi:hypothetical protein
MFEDLQKAMADAKLLGALITWDLHTSGTLLTRTALKDAAEEHDVPLEIDEPRPEGVFRKIVSSVRTIRKPLISRLIREDDGVLVWALVDTSLEGDEQVGDEVGRMVNRVAFRRVSVEGQPLFTFEVEDDVSQAVADKFDYQLNYLNNDDVRTAIGATLRQWGAIRIHARMYFLGRSQVENAQRMQAALQQVGTRFWLIPIPDLMDSTASIAHHAHERFAQELKDLRKEVDLWASGERAPRTTTLKARLKAYDHLRAEIDAMTDTMQLEAADLLDELAGLSRGVAKLLKPTPEKAREEDPAGAVAPDATPATTTPVPPSRPATPAPRSRALDQLTVEELRVRARDLSIRPMPRSKKKLVAAIQHAGKALA